jgi:hypothetical protein
MRDPATPTQGITLRQAALTAGVAYLLNPVAFAEAHAYSLLIIPNNMPQTVQNIAAHRGLFVAVILCYLVSFILDIVLAWALYHLLAPVNRALSQLTAWFRLIYAAVALCATLNLTTLFTLLNTPDYLKVFGPPQTYAQVRALLVAFRSGWSISLLVFGMHLVLLGYLMFRFSYLSNILAGKVSRIAARILGILLLIDGLAWILNSLAPYFFPNTDLFTFLFPAFCGEIVFMLWLLIAGWRIQEPDAHA